MVKYKKYIIKNKIMDFNELKRKALELKKKAEEKTKEAIDYSSKKLADSNFTISTKQDLISFIEQSKNTTYTVEETGEEKTSIKKVIVIFWDEKSDFFKEALYQLPIIWTKAFSQNVKVKLVKHDIEWIDLSKYKVEEVPSMVVFENKDIYKVITWKENIKEVVKKLSLDINKIIEEINS